MLFLIYNFCAFALQMPLGVLTGRHGRAFAVTGCILVFLAFYLTGAPMLAAICAGIGNAAFHIGGGAEVLSASDRFGPLGVFVSPGAIGLYLGRICTAGALLPQAILLAALLLLLTAPRRTEPQQHAAPVRQEAVSPVAVLPVAALLCVVILRSFLGLATSMPGAAAIPWLTPLAVAGGKALGGLLADRVGVRRTSVVSLVCAAALFPFAGAPLPALLALLLFNMTMPITLGAVARRMPGARAFGFGLLTFGLFLGYVPVFWGASIPLTAASVGCLLSLVLLRPAWKEVDHDSVADSVASADAGD